MSSVKGPGGLWCDVDVVEFSYFGVPTMVPKKQLSSEILDGLRGMDATIGSGTQVMSVFLFWLLEAWCIFNWCCWSIWSLIGCRRSAECSLDEPMIHIFLGIKLGCEQNISHLSINFNAFCLLFFFHFRIKILDIFYGMRLFDLFSNKNQIIYHTKELGTQWVL